ncbi:MAG: DUF4352 domain-containing protein [Symbiobacteriaceae bacterium]|nr:DUF4352 domain-containing protein [Symbiobacteriaceae bacterium]
MKLLKGVATFIGVLVMVGLIITILSPVEEAKTTDLMSVDGSQVAISSFTTPEQGSRSLSAIKYKETGNYNGLKITVNNVRVGKDQLFFKAKDGFAYYLLDITFDNTSNKSVNISVILNLCMVDSEGCSYNTSFYLDTKGSLGGEIAAGRRMRGEAVFEVPVEAEALEFVFNPILGKSLFFEVPTVSQVLAIDD